MTTLVKNTLGLFACLALSAGVGKAATASWTGATNDWSLGTNWSLGSAPGTGDLARFTTSGNTTPTLAAGNFTVKQINYNGNTNFDITGAGSANTTLTIDANSTTSGLAFIDSTAGTATNQTFSNVTVVLTNSLVSPQMKIQPGDGKAVTIASNSKLQIGTGSALALIVEANGPGTGSGALTINGVLTAAIAGSSIKADTSGVLNLNLAAGSSLANLSLSTGTGGVINFVGGGDFGGSVNPSNGAANLATSGITVGSTTSFAFGTAGTAGNSTIGATYTSGTSTIAGQVALTGGGGSARSNIFNVAGGGTLAISGLMTGGSTLNTAVSKIGNGTLDLTRSAGNTISASAFNVSVGTLLVNNTSGSATGATVPVNVASGATLGGNGTITGATTISGILAPGNSIGTLTIANDVTWNGGASASAATDWKFELGAGNTADLLNITGATSEFLKGSGSAFRFDFQGSTAMGTFKLVDWASTASIGGGALGTSFNIADFSYTNLGGGHIGTFQFNSTQLEFVAVVPEPSTWALLAFSLTTVVVLRRRRLQ